jgi:hypothetical protein
METTAARATPVVRQTTVVLLNSTEDGLTIYWMVWAALDKGLPVEFEYKGDIYLIKKRYSIEVFSRWMRRKNSSK